MKKNKYLYLHVGPHKTGTTYIQKTLLNSIDILYKSGIIYPDFGRIRGFGHDGIAKDFREQSIDVIKSNICILLNSDMDLLLSGEAFSTLNEEGLQKIQKVFSGFNIQILFGIRNLDEILFSRWKEQIKHLNTISCSSYILKNICNEYDNSLRNTFGKIDLLIKIFGDNKVKLFDYSYSRTHDIDLIDVIKKFINRNKIKLPDGNKNINKSLGYAETEVIRAINMKAAQGGFKDHKITPHTFNRLNNKKADLINKLIVIINENLIEVNLSNNTMLNKYSELILEKYSKNFITAHQSRFNSDSLFTIPLDNWLINPEAQHLINILYKAIDKDT